ncbi:MAG TPA: glycosyltransferase family 2 protein [Candidatus Binataceae bacterium]|jgi:glycosyltransferase involved in cell wall biosynthesis|nr:glycosyltransferase family 2 protein [Candidatus Binataceae bacterium]
MARDWLTSLDVSASFDIPESVHARGKFLSRNGAKFLLKATRLPDVEGALDLSEKLALRRRLDELAAVNVNTLIVTEAQAEAVLGVAGQAGVQALVEIAINAEAIGAAGGIHEAVARIRRTFSNLRGYTALMGFVFDGQIEAGTLTSSELDQLRSELAAVARTIRESHGKELIGIKRCTKTATSVYDNNGQPIFADICADLTYVRLARSEAAKLAVTIAALHRRLAGARPLVIEFGEELFGHEEMVAHAFGLGAAGVVAPAMRPAASPGWRNGRMLGAGELSPFAQVPDSSVPLPASPPPVSVVVIARDDEATMAACLQSIESLHYPNYEVIVVDGGSIDRSAEIAANFAGGRPRRVMRERRVGFGAACNAAMRAARGQLIAFTRADCTVDADWLALSVRTMIEGRLEGCRGPIYRAPVAAGIAARAIASLVQPIEVEVEQDRAVLLSQRNMIVRKASLIAVGGFDARFVEGGADAELSARMIEAQMTLGWCAAGWVWRGASGGVGEFYHRRIRHGRIDARLRLEYPDIFGSAAGRAQRATILHDGQGAGRAHDGIVIRSLSKLFSLSGALAEALAYRQCARALKRTPVAEDDLKGGDCNAAHHLPIANNHAHPAHPAAHR